MMAAEPLDAFWSENNMTDLSMIAPTQSSRLDGRKSLVTGASRGIGFAVAAALAQARAKLARTPADRAAAFRLLLLAAAVAQLAAAPAFAEAPPRVRGVMIGVNNDSITVKERDGSIVTLKTGTDTAYAYVVPSSLDAIKVNDFVGTAVKGPMKSMVAVELVIIPESMRAGRISYYGWDPLPDPTVRLTSDPFATSMTNGLVSSVSPQSRKLTNTNMTNGIVSAENGGAAGLTLRVSYDGGSKSFRITVPPTAPITRFEVADRSAIAIGSSVFIKTNPGNQAGLVTVGKGVTPPM
jgi:hypothetical protein